ncbi:MAG: type 1 glutamine amidotransferase [Caldilineales bacterium]|nr:type 1 glutamine amidotransferase [Caldilineales bacterium]
MNILFLQARYPDDPVREEERASFAARAQLPIDAIACHDLLQGPPNLSMLGEYQALMIGGSGDFNVSLRDLPEFETTLGFLRDIVDLGFPTFASCFGFQLMVQALGGEIIADPEKMEVGAFAVRLSTEGEADELFGNMPASFAAQFGHKERAAILPDEVVNLASTQLCPYQAFRIPGKPIWATQFHPELTADENRFRFSRYLRIYGKTMSAEEQAQTLEAFTPSPETERLIPLFLQIIANYKG